jgi:hypothetical protein
MSEPILTIFTAPKPFTNPHITVIQHNALLSWIKLGKTVQVLLIGEEDEMASIAKEFGIRQLTNVRRNQLGTPLISSMFEMAYQASASPYLAIVNTDILLSPDILEAIENVKARFEKFLIVGQRWSLNITEQLTYKENFYEDIRTRTLREGRLHSAKGSDYFIFPRSCFKEIPDFAIGRAGWDNWMIFKSRWEGWPLVNASQDVMVVHQKHDYSHLPNGQPHYRLPETSENVRLAGGRFAIFTLQDTNYFLKSGSIYRSRITWKKIKREIEIFPLTVLHSRWLGNGFYYLFHPAKLYQKLREWLRSRG